MTLPAVVLAVLASGGLDDVKAALERLPADKPVHAELKVTRWQRITGGKEPNETTGGVTFHVSDGKTGPTLHCSVGMLHEKAANIIGATSLMRVHKLLDAAPELKEQLVKAELVSEEGSTWQGRPARLLKVKLGPESFKKDGANGASIQATLGSASVWIAEDGTPLAAEISTDLEAGVLMIKATTHIRIAREYGVVNGRLVVMKDTEETQADAVGHGLQAKQVSELKLDEGETRTP
jgi:hypothetical protein